MRFCSKPFDMDCVKQWSEVNFSNIFDYEIDFNLTLLLNSTIADVMSVDDDTQSDVRKQIREVLVLALCVFGLAGHLVTLLVLTRRRLTAGCEKTERAVHVWLCAMALSGMLFCLALLPHSLLRDNRFAYETVCFELLYRTYGEALINTAILTSTWLAVVMSLLRYLVIVRHWRCAASVHKARIIAFFTTLSATILSAPKFFEYRVDMHCNNGNAIYFRNDDLLRTYQLLRKLYVWTYAVSSVLVPFLLLTACNCAFIRVLRHSNKLRQNAHVTSSHLVANRRITVILVTLILLFTLLVTPGEVVALLTDQVSQGVDQNGFLNLLEFTNILQTIHFTANFLPYYILHVHFRRVLRHLPTTCLRRVTHDGASMRFYVVCQRGTYPVTSPAVITTRLAAISATAGSAPASPSAGETALCAQTFL